MTDRVCAICGAPGAPFGLRLHGELSKMPDGKRGYLWTCASEDCRQEAERRRAKAMGISSIGD